MAELGPILGRLRLLHYHDRFVGEGFETWDQLCDITEADLEALDVGLGHRRRLQREIANALRPSDQRLSVQLSPSIPAGDLSIGRSNIIEADDSGTERVKRKYRRRPKADMFNEIWALANNPAGGWPPLTRDFLQRKAFEASRADRFHHT